MNVVAPHSGGTIEHYTENVSKYVMPQKSVNNQKQLKDEKCIFQQCKKV